MKLRRVGTSSDRGWSEVELTDIKYSFIDVSKEFQLESYDNKDFTTKSYHNYKVEITMEEICNIIKFLGSNISSENSGLISEKFTPCLKELIRITNTCVGELGQSK